MFRTSLLGDGLALAGELCALAHAINGAKATCFLYNQHWQKEEEFRRLLDRRRKGSFCDLSLTLSDPRGVDGPTRFRRFPDIRLTVIRKLRRFLARRALGQTLQSSSTTE